MDTTSGFAFGNNPIGLTLALTSAGNGLTLAMPSGGTGKFFTFTKNSGEFFRMSRFGEVVLDGTSTQSGTGIENSMLTLRGRTGTANILQLESSNGTQRFSVDGGGTQCVISTTGTYLNGSNFLVYDSGLSNIQFAVLPNGRIWSNQFSSASALGSLIGVEARYNTSGTLRGYVPIYATFTP
jgi:hypothetical protein